MVYSEMAIIYRAKIPEAWARVKWCEQQFGPTVWWNSTARWYRDGGYICFRDESDYVLYLLRWA